MSPAAGSLRHRVRIEERSGALDEFGQPLDDWMEVVTVWGAIEDMRGVETVAGSVGRETQAILNQTLTNVRIRYRGGIQPEMRAVDVCPDSSPCSGRVLDIASVNDRTGRRREIVLETTQRRVEAD